jgi:pimeloyl-ACP methyl ester carboxylesterase
MVTPSDAGRQHVVILIHGINTYALWQNEISATLRDNGFVAEPIGYGVYSVPRFLAPSRRLRRDAVDVITSNVTDIRRRYPGATISIIAHSFGTYVTIEFLRRHHDFQICRLVLCGSVLKRDTAFADLADRFEEQTPAEKIVNDCGTHDPWPILAASVTWGYGSSGTFGFSGSRVRNRWHDYLRHSDFLNEEFCVKYWIPFLRDGTLVAGARKVESIPWYMRWLSRFSVKYILIVVLVAVGASWYASERPAAYRVDPGENGIGYANAVLADIKTALQRSPAVFSPFDWWRGRRRMVLTSIDDEQISQLAIRGSFACESCYANQALDKFVRQFPGCLWVSRHETGEFAIDVYPSGVEPWIDPETSRRWNVCRVRLAD